MIYPESPEVPFANVADYIDSLRRPARENIGRLRKTKAVATDNPLLEKTKDSSSEQNSLLVRAQ